MAALVNGVPIPNITWRIVRQIFTDIEILVHPEGTRVPDGSQFSMLTCIRPRWDHTPECTILHECAIQESNVLNDRR